MDTKLIVDEIQIALRNSGIWNKRQDVQKAYFDPLEHVDLWYVGCPECGDITGFEKPEPLR